MSLLGQPLALPNGRILNSRIVMAPVATQYANCQGHVTSWHHEYYRRRAHAGGLGAIVVEHAFVHPQGRLTPKQLGIYDDGCVPGLSSLVQCIREASSDGAVLLLQLSHAGSSAFPCDLQEGVFAPSPLVHPGHKRFNNTGIVPRELSVDQIDAVVDSFVRAALRARCAGFDGVEVHAAHGYLLDQFYSPLTNMRNDAYGAQSVENRARLTCRVVRAVRDALGPNGIVAVRVGPHDYRDGGADVSEAPLYARLLEAAGADVLDVSGGLFNFGTHDTRPPGFFRAASKLVRDAVGIPVLTAGGVHYPHHAEWLLETGACDLVGVGRALMRQPDWAARALDELGR